MPKKTFEEWKKEVDRILSNRLGGLTSEDLNDMDYYSLWNNSYSPAAAATAAIRNAKES